MPAPFVLKAGGRKGRTMKEIDVRGEAGLEKAQTIPDVSTGADQGEARDAHRPTKRNADDDWLAFAAEDPAFFIKTSDTA